MNFPNGQICLPKGMGDEDGEAERWVRIGKGGARRRLVEIW